MKTLGDEPRVHAAYFEALTPEWGGNGNLMQAYVDGFTQRFAEDHTFAWLFAKFVTIDTWRSFPSHPEAALAGQDLAKEIFESAEVQRRRGEILMPMGRIEEAYLAFHRAVALDPDDARAQFMLGSIHLAFEDLQGALDGMRRGIELDPYNPILLSLWGKILLDTLPLHEGPDKDKLIFEAKIEIVEALDRLLVYAESEALFHWQRGDYFKRQNDAWAKAAASYKRAAELEPNEARYWLDYALALYWGEDCDASAVSATYLEVCNADEDCRPDTEWTNLIRDTQDWCSLPEDLRANDVETLSKVSGMGYKRCGAVAEADDKANKVAICRALAESGNADAQYDMGLILVRGVHVERDEAAAFAWFSRAAELGDKEALASLGGMYFRGMGVAADRALGIKLWQQAAEAGVSAARLELAMLYYHGAGLEQDKARAEAMLRALVEEDYHPARRQLSQHFGAS